MFICISFILTSGCISESDEEATNTPRKAAVDDLRLHIWMNKSIFSLNSSDILLSVTITCISDESVSITGDYYQETQFYLIINDTEIIPQRTEGNPPKNDITIKPDENITYDYNLAGVAKWYIRSTGILFSSSLNIGGYKIYAIFMIGGGNYVESNMESFEIKDA